MHKDRKRIASSIGWMTFGNWGEQLSILFTFIILSRVLGPEAIGLVAMASVIIIFGEVLVNDTLTEYLIATTAEDHSTANTIFFSLIFIAVVLYIGLFASSGIIAQLYGQPIVEVLLHYLGASVVILAFGAVPASLLRRDMKFKTLAIRSIVATFTGASVAVWMAFNGYGVWALVLQRLVQNTVNSALAWWAVSWRPRIELNSSALFEIIGFGGAVLALRSAHLARLRLPMALIGAIYGPIALGYFSLSLRLVETGSHLITGPIRKVSQSAFAARLRAGHAASGLLIELSKLSGWVTFPVMFGMMAISEPLISLIFGDRWAPASSVLAITSVVGIYYSIELINQSYCLAVRKVRRLAVITWLDVVIMVGAIWLPNWQNVTCASYAFAGSLFVLWILHFATVSKFSAVSVKDLILPQILPLGASITMALIVTYFIEKLEFRTDMPALIAGGTIGLFYYGAISFALMSDRVKLARQYF